MFLLGLELRWWMRGPEKHPEGRFVHPGVYFPCPWAASLSPLFTFLYCLKAQSSRWPFETRILSQHQLYLSGAEALLRPAVSAYLLEEELWLPGDKARRCLPAAGPGSHLQRAHKGALCWLRGALQSLKTELCGENRHKFPVQIVIRVFQREAAVHLLLAWRCYHTVTITVELGLGISCLKWLSKRGCICCSISLWC